MAGQERPPKNGGLPAGRKRMQTIGRGLDSLGAIVAKAATQEKVKSGQPANQLVVKDETPRPPRPRMRKPVLERSFPLDRRAPKETPNVAPSSISEELAAGARKYIEVKPLGVGGGDSKENFRILDEGVWRKSNEELEEERRKLDASLQADIKEYAELMAANNAPTDKYSLRFLEQHKPEIDAEYEKLKKSREQAVRKPVYRNKENTIISNYRFRDIPQDKIKDFSRKLAAGDTSILSTKEGAAFYTKYSGLIEPLVAIEKSNAKDVAPVTEQQAPASPEEIDAFARQVKKGGALSTPEGVAYYKKYRNQIEARMREIDAEDEKADTTKVNAMAIRISLGDYPKTSEDLAFLARYQAKIDARLLELEENKRKTIEVRNRIEARIQGESEQKKQPPAPESPKETLSVEERVKDIGDRMMRGEPVNSSEDLQFQANHGPEIEAYLLSKQPKEAQAPQKAEEPKTPEVSPRVFTEEDKKKHKELAERLYFEEDDAVMTPEEKAFYEDPMNKSAIHRERTRLARKEEKFGNTIQDIEEKRATEKERLFAAVKDNVKDPRVLAALEKMNLGLEYVYKCGPKFFDMDGDKQLYILEKVRQKVSLDATFEAKARVAKDLARKPKSLKDRLKKIWQGLTKEFEETKARRAVIEEVKATGMEDYSLDIEAYVNHVVKLDTPIHYDEKGKLRIDYVNPENSVWTDAYLQRFEKGTKEADYIQKFNEAATALSEIPYEWTQNGSSILEKRGYAKALELYELRKTILLGGVTERVEKEVAAGDEEAAREIEGKMLAWMNMIDKKVEMNRLLTTYPEIEKEEEKGWLRSINPDDWTPNNPESNNWKDQIDMRSLSFMAAGAVAGAVGRNLSRMTGGLGGSMIFGGALGGVLAWRKKQVEYNEKEKNKRYGIDPEKGQKEKNKDRDAKTKETGIKRYLDAYLTARRIEKLTEAIVQEFDEAKRAKMIETLNNRIAVTDERLRTGRVNFGNKNESSANKLHLIQAMADARAKLFTLGAYNSVPESKAFFDRFNQFQKDLAVKKFKRKDLRNAFFWGAVKGAGGALAGWAIADVYAEDGSTQSGGDRFREIRDDGGDGTWNDVPQGLQPYNGGPAAIETPAVPIETRIPVSPEEIPTEPVLDEAPLDTTALEDTTVEEVIDSSEGDDLAQNLETPTAQSGASYEIPPEIKDDLKMSPDGRITGIQNVDNFESVKKFGASSGDFVADMSKSGLPENFQTRSWGMQALSRVAPEAKEFLAWQEVLQTMPEDAPDAEMIRGKMVDLGESIREDLAGFAKDKSGVETLGNFFKPYEEWIGTTTTAPPIDATASVEGAGLSEDIIPPTEAADQATTSAVENTASVEESAVGQPNTVEQLNETVTRSYNGENPVLDFGTENDKIRGTLEFVKDADGEIIDVKVPNDGSFDTKVGQEFRKHIPEFISNDDLAKFGVEKAEAVDKLERYLDLSQALETSELPTDAEEALAIKKELADIDQDFKDKTGLSVESRLQAIEQGGGIEYIESPTAPEPEWQITTNDKIPVESEVIKGAIKEFGEPLRIEGNIALFEDDKVGFFAESKDLGIAKEKAMMSAKVNGFPTNEHQVYGKAFEIDGVYRVFYVFEK